MAKLVNKLKYYFVTTKITLNMTKEDEEKSDRANICWLCNQPFTSLSSVINTVGKVYGK